MKYLGSEQHLKNLIKARSNIGKIKFTCKFCKVSRSKANIVKHEQSCYLNPINLKLCIICSTPIKNKDRTTCGYSCSNKHFRTGPNNGNWKNDVYRTTCFHYHKKECIICGESNIISVHHLDENHNNNDPSNLIPLCPTHHQYWHSQYKHLIEEQVFQYQKKWKALCL